MDISTKMTKRLRGENWTQEEKDIFVKIMRQSASVIDNKQNDSNTNRQKKNEWLKIQKRLGELSGHKRDIDQIKGLWKRLKVKSKAKHKSSKMNEYQPDSPAAIYPTDEYETDELVTTVIIPNMQTKLMDQVCEQHKSPNHDIEMHNNLDNRINSTRVEVINVDVDVDYLKNKEYTEAVLDAIINGENKEHQSELSHKADNEDSNVKSIKRTKELLEEEYALKVKYQKRELNHQRLRHKIELDLLLLEKQKKELEIQIMRKSLE